MREQSAVFDIETNGINFEIGNDPDQLRKFHVGSIRPIPGECAESSTDLQEFVRNLDEYPRIIGHNIVSFDIPALRRFTNNSNLFTNKGIVDTLILSRLLWPDRPWGHGLRAWGELLGHPKGDVESFEVCTPEMIEYNKNDVELNYKVYEYLQGELGSEPEIWDDAIALEHEFAELFAEQEHYGCAFDIELAGKLEKKLAGLIGFCDRVIGPEKYMRIVPEREIHQLFKINGEPYLNLVKFCDKLGLDIDLVSGPFSGISWEHPDLNSDKQQKELLLRLGWKPRSRTPTGEPQIDSSILQVPIIGEWLQERNGLSNRLSKVQGLVRMLDDHGIIHAGGNTIGTPTARLRHKRVTNIPKVSVPFGWEFRSLFRARPGKILCGYDASSLELRMLAHYIGDRNFISLVLSDDKTNDAHTLARDAAIYAGGTNATRNTGKTINYALVYGAMDPKLGEIIGLSPSAGAKIRSFLMAKIKGYDVFIKRVETEAEKGFLYGLDGRKMFLRQKRKGLNTLIQGGGSIYMKTVAVFVYRLCKPYPEYKKVIDQHDESQVEIPDTPEDKERFAAIVNKAFDMANKKFKLRCPQSPEIKFGYTWAETH